MKALERNNRRLSVALLLCAVMGACIGEQAVAQESLYERQQAAIHQAVERVAPSVVRIETVGGLERSGAVLFGTGPTTGLIVSPDGFIVSSAFNFAQKPSSILVGLPDGTRTPAKLVATDYQRMLVLLKVTVEEQLPVPEAAPEGEMAVGQWAIAVGRTFDSPESNVSVGIVSALGRVWGKALQTDARVSPSNYGGPLVDIRGRVMGVLVPLSPTETGEMAGVEWYDSGIGFAVPIEQFQAVLPRLAKGEDLRPGILGVSLRSADLYSQPPVIVASRPNSPAYQAGLRAGDQIVEINGVPIEHLAHLRHQLNRRYAGDTVHVVVARDSEKLARDIPLVDHLEPYQRPFLGILPRRDSESVVVRYVYPGSPAETLGLKPGDAIDAVDGEPVKNFEELAARLSDKQVGAKVAVTFVRDDNEVSADVQLAGEPDALPAELPAAREPSPAEVAKPAVDVGVISIKLPEFGNECLAYVPEKYDPNVRYGLVIWFHAAGGDEESALLDRWRSVCDANDLILLAPRSSDRARWAPTELEFVRKVVRDVMSDYHVDPARVVACGRQTGGVMALIMSLADREIVRGAGIIDAPLVGRVPENDPAHRMAFFVARGPDSRFAEQVNAGLQMLRGAKYSVKVEEQEGAGGDLNADQFAAFIRWIDSLDKL